LIEDRGEVVEANGRLIERREIQASHGILLIKREVLARRTAGPENVHPDGMHPTDVYSVFSVSRGGARRGLWKSACNDKAR
jgi:hypothetical protein